MRISLKANTFSLKINLFFGFSLFIFLFTQCKKSDSYNYYQDPILEEYHIFCNIDSLNYIYKNYQKNTYIPIKIVLKGDTLKGRMRIRGDSSRKDDKKSLKVKFVVNGKSKTLNFNAEFSDKSFIRQYLSSQIMRASGQHCFNSSFANVFINGVFLGLYL